jgi:cytochrome bd ubiquinol oxidase subunit II
VSLTAVDLLAGTMLVALTAYVLLAGADFGGGVWDLFARGPRRERQRAVIEKAMGPVWEANHVWLILVVVLLFNCFPSAFSRLVIALHIPLTLILIGIVLRGSAFIFRSYGGQDNVAQQRWGRLFAISSLVTPLLLGVGVGTVAAGRVQLPSGAGFVADYVSPWLTSFAVSVGGLTLALFAFLAAVYLTNETREPDLREDFRRRAIASSAIVFVMAATSLILAWRGAPLVWNGLVVAPGALPFHLIVGAAATTALFALWQRRWRVARVAAVAQVTGILWGWALSQYPWLLPPTLSIADAAAPPITLKLTLGALGLGAIVLLPSLFYLFRIFKTTEQAKGAGSRE